MTTKTRAILGEEAVEDTAHVLRCLGHPLRLRILDVLEKSREVTVTEVYEALQVERAGREGHAAS